MRIALIFGEGPVGGSHPPQTRADLVAMALELTDTLIVQLAEDSDDLAAPTVTMEVKP